MLSTVLETIAPRATVAAPLPLAPSWSCPSAGGGAAQPYDMHFTPSHSIGSMCLPSSERIVASDGDTIAGSDGP